MTTITTRTETQTDGTSAKGSELTWSEVDNNFINLNDDKVEVSGAIVFAALAGEALSKGDVVYVSGVSGNTPTVAKADADDASKMPAFGLAEADTNSMAAVNVVTFGTLYNLDTSGFSAGDTVYVSTTAGALTATKPAGESSLIQNVGKVIRSHATAGSIKVGGAGRTNDTPNLNDGNVFIGNASNQTEARSLTGDDISGGTITSFASTGIDDNASSTVLTLEGGSSSVTSSTLLLPTNNTSGYYLGSSYSGLQAVQQGMGGTTVNLRSGNTNILSHNQVQDNLLLRTNSTDRVTIQSDGDVAVDTDTFFVDAVNDRVGVNNSSPSVELHVKNVGPGGNPYIRIESTNTSQDGKNPRLELYGETVGGMSCTGGSAGGTLLYNESGTNGVTAKANGTIGFYTNGSAISPDVELNTAGNLEISANVIVDGFVEADSYRTTSAATTALTLTSTGSATVGEDLTVTGNFTSTGIDDNAASTTLKIDSNNSSLFGFGGASLGGSKGVLNFKDANGGNSHLGWVASGSADNTASLYFTYASAGSANWRTYDSGSSTYVTRMSLTSDGTVQFNGAIEEQQYSLTGTAINPANGTIQYKTLGANTTFTESLSNGEFVTLMIDDGSNRTVTWPTTTWVGGSAPILQTSGYNVIELWKVNGTLYGAFVGTA
ncbi:MAG: hypothetical protein ACPHEP_02940 [Acidimicrobiales bacterium]